MSSTNVDLGNVEYVYLENISCNGGDGGADVSQFVWTLPNMKPNQAPYMFIQVAQLYVDHTDGAGTGQPQHLRLINLHGLNSYSTSGSTELAGLMERDALGGHWNIQSDAPMLQVPTSINQLTFTVNQNLNGDPITLGANASISVLLKIVRPHQNVVTKNIMLANVKTF